MATTKAQIKKLVDRLVGLPGKDPGMFGEDMVASIRGEFGRALERYASSDDEATRAVDWLIFQRPANVRTFRPAAGEIPDAITRVREIASEEMKPTGCEICNGAPWITIEKLVYEFPKAKPGFQGIQYMASGSARCSCPKGVWFRQKDRENDAKRAAGLPV